MITRSQKRKCNQISTATANSNINSSEKAQSCIDEHAPTVVDKAAAPCLRTTNDDDECLSDQCLSDLSSGEIESESEDEEVPWDAFDRYPKLFYLYAKAGKFRNIGNGNDAEKDGGPNTTESRAPSDDDESDSEDDEVPWDALEKYPVLFQLYFGQKKFQDRLRRHDT